MLIFTCVFQRLFIEREEKKQCLKNIYTIDYSVAALLPFYLLNYVKPHYCINQTIFVMTNCSLWSSPVWMYYVSVGHLVMDLNHMLPPSKSPEKCNLQLLDQPPDRLVCLFEQKTVKGWWPCTCEQNGQKTIAVRTQTQLILKKVFKIDARKW